MTAIDSKHSVSQNWQTALKDDGVVTKDEADKILDAARNNCISGKEKDQAEDVLKNARAKADSLMAAARHADELGRSGDPRAAVLARSVTEAAERQRQNLETAEHLASTIAKEKANQNIFQNIWSWFF